jgi:hypothetical protein
MFATTHSWLPGVAGQALSEPSVFESNVGAVIATADSDNLTMWGNAVAAVATAPAFLRIEFLKVVGLFASSDGQKAVVVDESLLVRPNTMYELKVFQQVPEPGPPPQTIPSHSVELRSFSGHVTALRDKLQAVGKYDMLTFVIRIRDLSPGERTAVEIPHTPDAATTASALTSLYLPLTIQADGKAQVISAVVLALFALFFMFWPHIASLPEDVVRNIATIIFVLTLSGPSRALASMWPSWPWRF